MTTRREFIKVASALGLGGAIPALPALASGDTVKPPVEIVDNSYRLHGIFTLYDPVNHSISMGEIAFRSDGASRSEIVVTNPDSGEEHRLLFTRETNWRATCHLIDVIREICDSYGVR